jgi:hypothetical protein
MIIEISAALEIGALAVFKTRVRPQKRTPFWTTAKPHLPQPRPEPLPPLPDGSRYVHYDGREEREPIDLEPFTVVERRGDYEYVSVAVFRSPNGDDFIYRVVKPRLMGDWEVTDACTKWFPLPDGREQGFWILIRGPAKGVRS